jgi:uncharacterized protein
MKKMRWKTRLGGPDSVVKRKIFGENSARLYKYAQSAAYDAITTDQVALMKGEYQREGGQRNNAYYGYVPKLASSSMSRGDLTPAV